MTEIDVSDALSFFEPNVSDVLDAVGAWFYWEIRRDDGFPEMEQGG